jgi:hypothetical protein
MVEFAFVFALFLAMLLAIIDSWVWTIESNAADAAVEQGIGVALAAPAGAPTSTVDNTAGVYPSVAPLLRQAMFATDVTAWTVSGACPTTAEEAEPSGTGHVFVCAENDGAGHVTVVVAGYALSFVPPPLSLFVSRPWGLPISESASVSVGIYAP